ncbi:glycoside hydrolase family 32 protein [Paenibacillus sp. HGF5]|uniref:glycoside hydrolase family 32 protein n=1 Tax=Paenibacillus sp. HGF5 TaxID=908341 RepID=UPI0002072A0B|nr:glycoside hydrolase family 32 protein [Paenibacillus sp. HGF5]EGG37087.1 putative fructan beta-fructosidase [Paenibacillus sp. HGF5]
MTNTEQQNYRNAYHFSPQKNWMNDPNGMVYFKGEYHLFYQHHPFGTTWGPMHWGHAVSKDLVFWEELPIALAPDEHGTIFSGSAVVDWNNTSGFFDEGPGLVAIFTHHHDVPGAQQMIQYQSLAYSKDEGRTWTKYEGNPVLGHDSYVDFRDPKVFWHEPSSQWVMIVACGQTVCLYQSSNLKEWVFASEFGEGIGFHDGVWECPDLFPLATEDGGVRWVMLVSIGDDPAYVEGSRTQYFIGDFDGTTFMPDERSKGEVRWLDYGRDNYAGVSWSDIPAADGRRLFIGWMSNWKYANLTPTDDWRGAMTLVRELKLETLEGEVTVTQQPVREMEAHRTELLSLHDIAVDEAAARLAAVRLESCEILVRFDAAFSLGLKVRTGLEQETLVGWDAGSAEVYVDRSRSGQADFHRDFPGKHTALLQTSGSMLEMRIFVDRSSVELFADRGQAVITDLIYPDPASTGITVFADDERKVIESLHVYEFSSPGGQLK